MVNLYNLEWELLKRSKITDIAPKSIVDSPSAEYAINTGKYSKDEEISE